MMVLIDIIITIINEESYLLCGFFVTTFIKFIIVPKRINVFLFTR